MADNEFRMKHLNNNSLVAISIETTCDNPRLGDIVEVCIMLLDNFLKPSTKILPYYQRIRPFRPEAIDFTTASTTKEKILEAIKLGLEPSMAADRLDEWLQLLNMPESKRLVPLTYNWPVVREYLHTWLGTIGFKSLFHACEYRDIMSVALYFNDKANQHAELVPYPRPEHAPYLGHLHAIKYTMSNDVMVKALKFAEIYKAMLHRNA